MDQPVPTSRHPTRSRVTKLVAQSTPGVYQVERVVRPASPTAPAILRSTRVVSAARGPHFGATLTGLQAHDMVTEGLSVSAAKRLMASFSLIGEDQLYKVLGITSRTLQRRAASAHKSLDSNASDRALRLMTVTERAIQVFGTQAAAEAWLVAPAMGLDQRKPIDLLRSTEGTEMVKTFLGRIEYGVYT